MHRSEIIMGMPVSIDIRTATNLVPFQKVFKFLEQVDRQFSPYIPTSEVSQYRNGKLSRADLSDELNFIIDECIKYEVYTDGYFSAYYNGSFDPSGYVKAWAIAKVDTILSKLGFDTYLINIAGDMIAKGTFKQWNIAIQNPSDKQSIVGTVALKNQSIATSGMYVKSDHILDPHTKRNTTDLESVTICNTDIVSTDVYATACIAMGYEKSRMFLSRHPSHQALLIKSNRESVSLNGFHFSS